VQPPVFFDVLSIAAAFLFSDDVVVFTQRECGERRLIKRGGPFEDGLGVGGKWVEIFLADECDKDRLFIDDHCPAAAEPLDDGDACCFDLFAVDKFREFA